MILPDELLECDSDKGVFVKKLSYRGPGQARPCPIPSLPAQGRPIWSLEWGEDPPKPPSWH